MIFVLVIAVLVVLACWWRLRHTPKPPVPHATRGTVTFAQKDDP